MTDDLTGGLDLLGDWLDAKGYGEEAGLCTRVMDHMHKQDARIAAFETANLELRKEADMMHSEYKAAIARIAVLEAALKPFSDSYAQIKTNWTKIPDDMTYSVSVKDLRKAHAALAGTAGKC